LQAGRAAEALQMLGTPGVEPGEIWSDFVCLEAECCSAMGRHGDAARALEGAVARGTDNHWVFHGLAREYLILGDAAGYAAALRQAHTALGWPESVRNGYVFTHDYFSANIPDWRRWFATLITAAPIACLEIGSWQGGSTTWLLDKVVGPRGGRLTCIDTFAGSSEHAAVLAKLGRSLEQIFDENVARTGQAGLCQKLVGRSQDVLPWLHDERFDFIYVDGAHEAKYVIQDAVLCWPLLRAGGFLLFDDTNFAFRDQPEQNTRTAVTAFRTWFADEIETLTQDTERQWLMRKR
jgi:predicted O-methyltransferase YrrM